MTLAPLLPTPPRYCVIDAGPSAFPFVIACWLLPWAFSVVLIQFLTAIRSPNPTPTPRLVIGQPSDTGVVSVAHFRSGSSLLVYFVSLLSGENFPTPGDQQRRSITLITVCLFVYFRLFLFRSPLPIYFLAYLGTNDHGYYFYDMLTSNVHLSARRLHPTSIYRVHIYVRL